MYNLDNSLTEVVKTFSSPILLSAFFSYLVVLIFPMLIIKDPIDSRNRVPKPEVDSHIARVPSILLL